jgi:uncharacterized protein YeaO (DUF488 family)
VVKIKRVYENPAPADGRRYLVDRLWPRGVSKDTAQLTAWLKELAPSEELRRWFHQHPDRWEEFQSRYRQELHIDPVKIALVRRLAATSSTATITLVFAAKDPEHNNAQALKNWIEQMQD